MDIVQTSKIKLQNSDRNSTTKRRAFFDLEERMSEFGIGVIKLCKGLPKDSVTRPLISQIVRSATSIGTNYSEANNASSRKDFRNEVHIAKKEAQETKHWLKMLEAAEPDFSNHLGILWRENHEISLMLQSIANKLKDDV
jgi:four helix bundle protein